MATDQSVPETPPNDIPRTIEELTQRTFAEACARFDRASARLDAIARRIGAAKGGTR